MKLLFVDETSDANRKDYFGICAVLIDAHSYKLVKESAQKILHESGWGQNFEFKGKTLFSAKSGDTSIEVEKRIELAKKLLDLNFSSKNGRMNFAYCDFYSTNFKYDYLTKLPALLNKLLVKAAKKSGSKNLLSIHYDHHQSLTPDEVRNVIFPTISSKGYYLFENVIAAQSNFETVGILYADLVAYLYGRHEIHKLDIDLFNDFSPEQFETDTRYRKLRTSQELLGMIKNLKGYEVA